MIDELDLSCDFSESAMATFDACADGDLVIEVIDCEDVITVFYTKQKAAQLRDWLNEFLGEPK